MEGHTLPNVIATAESQGEVIDDFAIALLSLTFTQYSIDTCDGCFQCAVHCLLMYFDYGVSLHNLV